MIGTFSQSRIAADGARRFQAVQHRHLHVHQNQVVGGGAIVQLGQRLTAVVGDVDLVAFLAKIASTTF